MSYGGLTTGVRQKTVVRPIVNSVPDPGSWQSSAGDVSHKPGGTLLLLSARPAVTLATLRLLACYQFRCLVNRGTMGVNSLPKTVTCENLGQHFVNADLSGSERVSD